tara:strand:- start:1538 stop:1846 length:309 start_codon:yes stop_codon:yes gene_type:complete
MNASIKLKEITKFGTGTKLAIFEVTLGKGKFGNLESTFTLSSTGMSLRVINEHSTVELMDLCLWLKEASKDESNLRTNESELRIFAKDAIKLEQKLWEERTL